MTDQQDSAQPEPVALLPCPFCGHDDPYLERVGTARQSCIVECGMCGARHESSDEGERSGSSWNERATITTAQAQSEPAPLTDERIDYIADLVVKGMPEGISGFCKSWGWRQFARAILEDCRGHLASAQAASAEPAAPTEGAQAKRTPLEALKTYEPDVVIEESRGRLTATGAAMKQQAAGRWVRLEDVCAALATRTPDFHANVLAEPHPDSRGQAREGWKLVPVEPCDLLLNSFLTGYGARGGGFNAAHLRDRARRGYAQMLAAVDIAFERGIYEQALAASPTSDAAHDVLAERRRQVEAEGWTPEHDDEHDGGQLAAAGAAYAAMAAGFGYLKSRELFPWCDNWWKPSDDRRNLVKAGALILAEIERLDRAALAGRQQL